MTAPTERDINEILWAVKERDISVNEAEQAIATHYRQKFEKLIGEDEDIRKKTSFQVFDDATRIRNEFRAQLRAKLKEEL